MAAGATRVRPEIVGRERELATVERFVEGVGAAPAALVLTGAPGSGKTTLWEAGTAAASERGIRVLAARASGAETSLTFAGIADLLDGVDDDELAAGVPAPQLHALRVATLQVDPGDDPPEMEAICAGFRSALRTLGASGPVLVAIDDLQWLDKAFGRGAGFRGATAHLRRRRPVSGHEARAGVDTGRASVRADRSRAGRRRAPEPRRGPPDALRTPRLERPAPGDGADLRDDAR